MDVSAPVRISIIVACRNEATCIRGFLDSLATQEMDRMEWEAILADGMSDDGTREILEECAARNPRLRVISNPGRIASTGLNAALRMARGEIVLRMDAHTRYATDYCRRSVETLMRTGADNVGGPARTDARGARARAIAAAFHSRFSTGGARFHDENYEGWVDTVPYGCWRKSTLERIGAFDEDLVRSQDDELNLRILRGGGKIWQSPRIVSWYSPRTTLAELFRQYLQYGFWKVAVIRKHRIPASWRHLVPAAFILANLAFGAGVLVSLATVSADWTAAIGGVWLALLCAYAGATIAASFAAVGRSGWAALPYLPAVFATYHFGYGVGFLRGLCKFGFAGRGRPVPAGSIFARITR
jgi:glycosyltransferase involved in cell wall biosynthesis